MAFSTGIPAFFNMQCTDKGDKLSTDFYLYNDQLFQALNDRITIYGVNVPTFTNADVGALPTNLALGTMWYNSDLDKLQFKGAGGIQTITSV